MEKITPSTSTIIPVVDLSPFTHGGDDSCRKMAIKTISEACTNLGIFIIENKCVSDDKCEKLLDLSKKFFSYSEEEKKQYTTPQIDPKDLDANDQGGGYSKMSDQFHSFEAVLMYSPDIENNGVPTTPPDYRETFEEVYKYLVETSKILEGIINDSLGFPPNFLTTYNDDRTWDFMLPMHYTTSNETGDLGIVDHEDPNIFTIILQGDVCGLEVFKDGEWIPIIPQKGQLVVVVSDVMQVLSNNKAKHMTHRALKNKDGNRLAIDFCYSFAYNKLIQPLPELTTDIGVQPKYRPFYYQEYVDLIMLDYVTPPLTAEAYTDITYFEI